MLSKVTTISLYAGDVDTVYVETDFSQGLPMLSLVGLPDATVRESKDRVRSAIINSGVSFPLRRITVNLSPADTRKKGSHFDLPVAVGIMISDGLPLYKDISNIIFIGELSLDGNINPVENIMALVIGARAKGYKEFVLPAKNMVDLAQIPDIIVYPATELSDVVNHISGAKSLKRYKVFTSNMPESTNRVSLKCEAKSGFMDFKNISGQNNAKRAMQICASGWHDISMSGPPGTGKTMLASAVPTILPEMDKEEILEVTKLHSIAGEIDAQTKLVIDRPYRAPHHSITKAALIGGGGDPKPGEISLAHRGVLFLDELPEFDKKLLDMLRQPLEEGRVNISRSGAKTVYPCEFILITAMNPCPCGNFGNPDHECICSPSERRKYSGKISGPLKDRIDLHIRVMNSHTLGYDDLREKDAISSGELLKGVEKSLKIQKSRYASERISYNSQLTPDMIYKYCVLTEGAQKLLTVAKNRYNFSMRSAHKLIKIARTIADIEGVENISEIHISEAIAYRIPEEGDNQ